MNDFIKDGLTILFYVPLNPNYLNKSLYGKAFSNESAGSFWIDECPKVEGTTSFEI
jgi:hypothetical protein